MYNKLTILARTVQELYQQNEITLNTIVLVVSQSTLAFGGIGGGESLVDSVVLRSDE